MFISVIITAWNRKTYLIDAVESVLAQSLNRESWELIVLKNFVDQPVDNLSKDNHIKNVIIEGTIGDFLYQGIKESKGEVISFLDDDDLFLKDKLKRVKDAFENDKRLVFYHNNSMIIDSTKTRRMKSRITRNPAFNLSSASIRKDILSLDKVKKIWASPDVFMYISAIDSGGKIKKGKEVLSYYRVNPLSTQTVNYESFQEYLEFKTKVNNNNYRQLSGYNELFASKEARRSLIRYELASYFYMLLFSDSNTREFTKYKEALKLIPVFIVPGVASTLINMVVSLAPKFVRKMYLSFLYRTESKWNKVQIADLGHN